MYPFERFTERAKKVLTLAQEEAERSHHSYIGTEHLLLGLLREGEGLAAKVLNNLGVEIGKVRETIESVLGRDERILIQQIIPTSRVKKVIEISFEEARRMGHNFVGTEHLLLGLILEGEGIAAHVLEDLGATLDKVRSEIEVLLRDWTEPAGPAAVPAFPPIDADLYRDVMSAFPTGVVIVTAFGEDGLPRGLTATAFSPVSLEPRLALVCIAKSSNTLPAVRHTRGFTANVLAAGREELARLMATKASTKFDGIEWRRSDTGQGGPILFNDSAAFAVCALRDTIQAGDHWVLIGTVVGGGHDRDAQPLLYHRRDYRAF
jgi:flavin reductase (DIM6/NTAB) family NADH-FMN oxidoreductase RutF